MLATAPINPITPPENGGNRQQNANCYGCSQDGHLVRSCPSIQAAGNRNNRMADCFGGQFQTYGGQGPRRGRWIKIRRNYGGGNFAGTRPQGVAVVEEDEDEGEFVWQEDEEDVVAHECEDYDQINTVELENAENHVYHNTEEITM